MTFNACKSIIKYKKGKATLEEDVAGVMTQLPNKKTQVDHYKSAVNTKRTSTSASSTTIFDCMDHDKLRNVQQDHWEPKHLVKMVQLLKKKSVCDLFPLLIQPVC